MVNDDKEQVNTRISSSLLSKMDEIIDTDGVGIKNRSDFIREGIRKLIGKYNFKFRILNGPAARDFKKWKEGKE